MSKQANQSDVWNYTVAQLQLKHPLTDKHIPQFGNFREDTGECLGVTSEQYGIIQNADLLGAAHEALIAKGLVGFTERNLVTANGARFFTEFTFADKQLATDVGDVFGYRLTLKNSFDRSMRAAVQLGFLRLTCKNGASVLEREFNVTRKHSSRVTVDFLGDAIDKAISQGSDALKVYDQMAKVEVSDEQGKNVLDQLVMIDALSGSLRDAIATLWLNPKRAEDKARTLYNLYNAVTEHLTHEVSQTRFEYADKVSNGILLRLVNAARHPDKLAKLIIPVPEETIQVHVDATPVVEALQVGTLETQIVG
jgi:hypothetical protein